MHTPVLFLSSLLILASAAPLPQVLPVPTNLPSSIQGVTSGVGVDPASLHLTGRQIRNADFGSSGPPPSASTGSGSTPSSISSPEFASLRSTAPSPTSGSADPQLSRRIELSDILKKLPLPPPLKRESSTDEAFVAPRLDSQLSSLKRQLPIPIVGPMLGMLSGGGAKPEHFETPFEHNGEGDEGPLGGSSRHARLGNDMPISEDKLASFAAADAAGDSPGGQLSRRIGENVNLWDVPVVDDLNKIHKRIGENVNLWDVPVVDGLSKIHKRIGQSVDLYDIPVVDSLTKIHKRIGESINLYEVPVVDKLGKLGQRSEDELTTRGTVVEMPEKRLDLGDKSLPLGAGGIGKGLPLFESLTSLGLGGV